MTKLYNAALLLTLCSQTLFAQTLIREADDYSSITAPFQLEHTISSPSGSRAFTTSSNSGEVSYDFSVSTIEPFRVELLTLSESSTKNSIELTVDNDTTVIDLPITANYRWVSSPAIYQPTTQTISITLKGKEAYTRIASIKITPQSADSLYLAASEYETISTPMKLEIDQASPSGSRVFTTQSEQGQVLYLFESLPEAEYKLQLQVLAESLTKNAFSYEVNGRRQGVSLTPNSYYSWFEMDEKFTPINGKLRIAINGVDPYMRIASLRLEKVNADDPKIALKNYNITNFTSSIDGNPTITTTTNLQLSSPTTFSSALEAALSASSPGTKIIIPDGTYQNQSVKLGRHSCPVGTSNQPIVIEAETIGGVVLEGASSFSLCGEYIVIKGLTFQGASSSTPVKVGDSFDGIFKNCTNCALRNIKVDGYSPNDPNSKSTWISILSGPDLSTTSQGLEISDSIFINKKNRGVIIYTRAHPNGSKHRVYRNYFSRPLATSTEPNEHEVIRIGDSETSTLSGDLIVENNVFENADGEVEAISIKSNDNIVRYNTFLSSTGTVTIRIGSRNIVEGNYFIGNHSKKSGGVRMNGSDNYVIANHFEGLVNGGSTLFWPISLLDGEAGECTGEKYCPVVNPGIASNFLINNDSSIFVGAKASASESIAPQGLVLSRNLIFPLDNSHYPIVSTLANIDGELWLNQFTGITPGYNFHDYQLERVSLLDYEQIGSYKRPKSYNDLIRLRFDKSSINFVSADIKSKVLIDGKSLYEMTSPLSWGDINRLYLGD